jgi:hypothetical protein
MTLLTARTGHPRNRGFSVLELLIATTIAMVILLVVTRWFRDLSNATAKSRALGEMSGQLRSVVAQLETDMRGATYPHGAMPGTVAPMGYIQYVEGMASDVNPSWPIINYGPGAGSPPSPLFSNVTYPAGTASSLGIPFHFDNIVGRPNPAIDPFTSRFGDLDDVLSLTTRNLDNPYRGSILVRTSAPNDPPDVAIQSIESPMAEVVWWVEGRDENGDTVIADAERQVHRRLFLIRPDLNSTIITTWLTLINPPTPVNPGDLRGFGLLPADALQIMREQCDISFSVNGPAANSLADLAAPRNQAQDNASQADFCRRVTLGTPDRVLLNSLAFPKVSHPAGRSVTPVGTALHRSRYGEDVMISSVAAFDIRIYDDLAPLRMHTDPGNGAQTQVAPGDPGFLDTVNAPPAAKIGQGAFVDLNYGLVSSLNPDGLTSSYFSGPPSIYSGFFRVNSSGQYGFLLNAFDTWAPAANNAMDGVDSNGSGVIDDIDELQAELPRDPAATNPRGQYVAPPYSIPLRALQVTLRTYDPDSRQIRQLKASASFTSD